MNPVDVKKKNDNLLAIDWDDGHESIHDMALLRKRCPCATCRGARSSENANPLKVLSSNEIIPENIHLKEAEIIGRYALQFTWSDGHHEGIYSFDFLRQQCQCNKCKNGIGAQTEG